MNHMRIHPVRIAAIVVVCLIPLLTPAADKLTDRTLHALARNPSHTGHKLWLFLDTSAAALEPISLTDRGRLRRARVDPVTLLIDERDYPVAPPVLRDIQETGARIRRISRWFRAVSIEATGEQVDRLVSLPCVARVDLVDVLMAPVEPMLSGVPPQKTRDRALAFSYGQSYRQNQFAGTVRLHQAGLTGKGVMIALFDSGFDIDQPAFDSMSIVAAYDFINDDTSINEPGCQDPFDPAPQNRHGTMVLSVIGGLVPDALIGVAPRADFVLAKTEITCDGTEIKVEEDNWIAAAEWADSIGVDIITSSLGYTVFQDSGSYTHDDLNGNTARITIAADMAASKNILVCNSAGNYRQLPWGRISFPADGDSVLAVGAVQSDSTLAPFSSPGPTADGRVKPDIVTLGVAVYTATNTGVYQFASGTSFAAPLVAGGAALALEHDGTLTAAELRDLIRRCGSLSSRPDNDFGYGLYDATRSADIIRVNPVDPIVIPEGHIRSVRISTSGRSSITPALSAIDLPPAAALIDHGDGTGSLELYGLAFFPAVLRSGLVADVGYFADTTYVTIEIVSDAGRSVYAAPNPFADSVRIIVSPSAGQLRSITVFNSAGERVWEKVNSMDPTADIITTWYGRNLANRPVAAGVYLIHVATDRRTALLKVLRTN